MQVEGPSADLLLSFSEPLEHAEKKLMLILDLYCTPRFRVSGFRV